ncbi:MAG: sugar ABC transporter ATP-binding protein [marine bacterium B5-7]|nr:MAG: sugar ABC transporter ATP-binding protein [marine bacterium B5-7]
MSSNDSNSGAVRIESICKDYRIYQRPLDRMAELLSHGRKTRHTSFRALDDISFTINKGETLGLIGPNGSGKSTLLEILCGTLSPTSGSIKTTGRIAALLELGAGFNPEFTGRENVLLNASIMGIDRARVVETFAEVEAFAEIGEFIDRPVKTYSSGMYVRLAFAAAINMDPDILVVDEALSVGDISFQRKCYRHFQEMQRRGVTIIFVTHAMELVRSHCHRAVYISGGKIRASGDPRDVVHQYLNDTFTRPEDVTSADVKEENSGTGRLQTSDKCVTRASYNPSEYRWGNRHAEIVDYELIADGELDPKVLRRGSRVRVVVHVEVHKLLTKLIYGLTVKTVDGITVFGANTRARKMILTDAEPGSGSQVEFEFCNHLLPGEYFISLGIAVDDDSVDNLAIDRRYDIIHISVEGGPADFGISDLDMNIHLNGVEATQDV